MDLKTKNEVEQKLRDELEALKADNEMLKAMHRRLATNEQTAKDIAKAQREQDRINSTLADKARIDVIHGYSIQQALYCINERLQFYPGMLDEKDTGFVQSLSRYGRPKTSVTEKQYNKLLPMLEKALDPKLHQAG